MRRVLLHVLPNGSHRISHYGLVANVERKTNRALTRDLLHVPADTSSQATDALVDVAQPTFVFPNHGAAMIIVDTFVRGQLIFAPPRQGVAARFLVSIDAPTVRWPVQIQLRTLAQGAAMTPCC